MPEVAHPASLNTFNSRSGFNTSAAAAAKLAVSLIQDVIERVIYRKKLR